MSVNLKKYHPKNSFCPARGIVGRATDCRVRGLGFESPESILLSRTETSSPSRVVRADGFPCSVPLGGWKKVSYSGVFDSAVEQPQMFKKLLKHQKKTKGRISTINPQFNLYPLVLKYYLMTIIAKVNMRRIILLQGELMLKCVNVVWCAIIQWVAAQAVRWLGIPKVARSHPTGCSKSCELWLAFASFKRSSGELPCERVVTASQLDLLSLTPLSLAGCGRLQLG